LGNNKFSENARYAWLWTRGEYCTDYCYVKYSHACPMLWLYIINDSTEIKFVTLKQYMQLS
jgi:hypothetical protein